MIRTSNIHHRRAPTCHSGKVGGDGHASLSGLKLFWIAATYRSLWLAMAAQFYQSVIALLRDGWAHLL
jgi:hypothetical protein